MRQSRLFVLFAVLAVASFAGWTIARCRAADPADKAPANEKSPAETSPNFQVVPGLEKATESLEVPTGNIDELQKFIDKVGAIKAPEKEDEIKPFVVKTRGAMLKAADKILASKPDSKQRLQAIHAKLSALSALENYADDAKAGQEMRDLAEELKKDKDPKFAKLGEQLGLQLQIRDLMEGKGTPENNKKLWAGVKAKLAASPDDKQDIQVAMMVAQALGSSSDTKLAVEAYHDLSAILSKSSDPDIVEMAKRFDATVRRLSLPGHPIELKGTLVSGKPFDQASLKGKVVLVDFWATWCAPCRAELPNVKRNYEKYHDKGFEVVGISLDGDEPGDREKLEKFLADEKITWPIIYGGEGEPHGWDESIAKYYGVGSIPTTILTDKQGDVVSLNARGKKLGELLETYLGK